MYTSTGFTVERQGRTSSFKTPSTGDAINAWKAKQQEITVKWPDRPDVSPVKPEGPTGEISAPAMIEEEED